MKPVLVFFGTILFAFGIVKLQEVLLSSNSSDAMKHSIQEKVACRIKIVSRPSAAEVFINGTKKGRTPFLWRGALKGVNNVRLEKEGREPEARVVHCWKDAYILLDVKLGWKTGTVRPIKKLPKAKAVYIRRGSFLMGSSRGFPREKPVRKVRIKRHFWMMQTEVTQAQYLQLLGNNPSKTEKCGDDCPVESVSWYEAAEFANRLSKAQGLPECFHCSYSSEDVRCTEKSLANYIKCKGWRLPTEAEWEYAARAGTTGRRYGKVNLIAWHWANARRPQPVKGKQANPWGLYDMLGNVWEWSFDRYQVGYKGLPSVDPIGARRGYQRVSRGGGFENHKNYSRSASRIGRDPLYKKKEVGFRLVKTDY